MKKKIIFCIHNYFFLKHYIYDIKKLEENFDITIIVSNYLIENNQKEYQELSKKINFKNFFIVPYYKNRKMKRSIFSIISSHLYLLKNKKNHL